jgi:hypothetical protein
MYEKWVGVILIPLTLICGVILGINLASNTNIPLEDVIMKVGPLLGGAWFGIVLIDLMANLVHQSIADIGDDDILLLDRIRKKPGDISIMLVRDDQIVGEYALARLSKRARAEWQTRLAGLLRGWLGRKPAASTEQAE